MDKPTITTNYAIFHACMSTELTGNGNNSLVKKSNFKIKVPYA